MFKGSRRVEGPPRYHWSEGPESRVAYLLFANSRSRLLLRRRIEQQRDIVSKESNQYLILISQGPDHCLRGTCHDQCDGYQHPVPDGRVEVEVLAV